MATWGTPHLRNALVALAGVLAAVVLAVCFVPMRQAASVASAPDPTSQIEAPRHSWPLRIVEPSPVADAVPAEDRPATTTTQAPPTTSTTAAAPTTTAPPASRPERIRDLVAYPFEEAAPGWSVTFSPPPQAGLLGLTDWDTSTIEVYVDDDTSDQELAFTLAHEMAHALDVMHLTDDERADYRAMRGISQDVDWLWEWDAAGDFSMPAGDFAESFAVATVGDATEFASNLGPPPSAEQQAQLLALLDDD